MIWEVRTVFFVLFTIMMHGYGVAGIDGSVYDNLEFAVDPYHFLKHL